MANLSPLTIVPILLVGSLATYASDTDSTASVAVTSAVAVTAHWPYSVPRPEARPEDRPEARPESLPAQADDSTMPTSPQTTDEPVRTRVTDIRRTSEEVIDGYARQMENCRFEATLHFDDQERSRLIGNDQACQSRYRRMMDEERRSLKRRISDLRSANSDNSLHPVSIR